MIPIGNDTGHPHFFFEKMGQRRESFDVLVVRGTYDFPEGADPILRPAEVQEPICFADEYAGPVEENPLAAVLAREGDLVLHKPSTDIHVVGTARAPGGRAVTDWVASVRVGGVHKRVRLLGRRRFEKRLGGWRLTDPEPITALRLDYRLAFGGAFTVPATLSKSGQPAYLTKQDNPAGRGWLPDERDLAQVPDDVRPYFEAQVQGIDQLDAPQIEDPDDPIRKPTQRAPAQGLGPIARWWAPRIDRTGTFDARWQAERSPGYPDDFDPRFFQSAHPDLVCPRYLEGDEGITLEGLLPEGTFSMRLPGRGLVAGCLRESGETTKGRMQLDTVAIDLDRRIVSLVWRGAFHRRDPAVVVEVTDAAAYPWADEEATAGGASHG